MDSMVIRCYLEETPLQIFPMMLTYCVPDMFINLHGLFCIFHLILMLFLSVDMKTVMSVDLSPLESKR